MTDETIAAVLAAKAVQKLADDEQAALRELLGRASGRDVRDRAGAGQGARPSADAARSRRPPRRRRSGRRWPSATTTAPVITDRKGNPEPDPDLRDNENVPLPAVPVSFVEDPTERFATLEYRTAVDDYMRDEVLPYVPDAWVDHDKHQDRVRDPADAPLLQVRAAAAAGGDRRRDQGAGGRDPASCWRRLAE